MIWNGLGRNTRNSLSADSMEGVYNKKRFHSSLGYPISLESNHLVTHMKTIQSTFGLSPFYGDLHNHCDIGYGHGSIKDAFQNARTQLDFACITAHAHWPDIQTSDVPADTIAYHLKGFNRTREEWDTLRASVEKYNDPNRFITFLGFEWHSLQYGDHHVCFNGSEGEIIYAEDLDQLRGELRAFGKMGVQGIMIPHHIGYKSGRRGIKWNAFDEEFSPVVEIMSMHGASEADQAPYPYLHRMGPRDGRNTLQYGLSMGNIVGVVGSTDHHSAYPGSYGHGRVGLWAQSLTRDSIWDAILSRRTYALTGDRIQLAFTLNNQFMGSVIQPNPKRHIEIFIDAGYSLDDIELIYNNRLINCWKGELLARETSDDTEQVYKVCLEMGWGDKEKYVDWEVMMEVQDGEIISVEPRFRGPDVLAPSKSEQITENYNHCEQTSREVVWFKTRTRGNQTTTTASTQSLCIEIRGGPNTRIISKLNNQTVALSVSDLLKFSHAGYLGGFVSPAYLFHRAIPRREYSCYISTDHIVDSDVRDWYYLRVRQKNGQYAWSSPIWVEPFNR
jgi:hypothetical protein